MKIDKRMPSHWLLLLAFAMQGVLGLLCRKFMRRKSGIVILYGHKLNGNLLALHDYLLQNPAIGLQPIFLTMDARYRRELQAQGICCEWAAGMGCSRLLLEAIALISDHGLHSLTPLQPLFRNTGLYFFDAWHAIPFKGFDADDFRVQHRYDETWVASELLYGLYRDLYQFPPSRIVITGYARTDKLVHPQETTSQLRLRHGVPAQGKLILFAPTWAQDARGRSIYPFNHDETEFLNALSELAQRHGATVLMRSHLNSGDGAGADHPNVVPLPSGRFPDSESILLMSDMLICDWSSIAFDFLLLNRPTFFLDVPAPFAKGFTLGPEFRFGPVVGSLQELLGQVEAALLDPEQYRNEHATRFAITREDVYGPYADGHSAQRCVERLLMSVRKAT